MIHSNKNNDTNNGDIESFNDLRTPHSYNASAFVNIDLHLIWQGCYENGISYVINGVNQTLIQPYGFP